MECFEKTMILLIHTSYLRDVASISVEKNVVSKRTKEIHVVFEMTQKFSNYMYRCISGYKENKSFTFVEHR